MIVWFLTNTLLTSCALLFLNTNKTAPHRFRFMFSFIALTCWLIPWGIVAELIPDLFIVNANVIREAHFPAVDKVASFLLATNASEYQPTNKHLSLLGILWVLLSLLSLLGIYNFAASLHQHARLISKLKSNTRNVNYLWSSLNDNTKVSIDKENIPIYTQTEVSGALTTGILSPKIWIHENLLDTTSIEATLLHEAKHIEHNDNGYLLVMTFIERVLWWNPLVRMLNNECRKMQELSCDEACLKSLTTYKEMLSELILKQSISAHQQKVCALSSNIFTDKNFNVQRVRLLDRRYTMKLRHIISAVFTISAALTIVSVGVVNAQEANNTTYTSSVRVEEILYYDLIKRVEPSYPEQALANGIEGWNMVEFSINENGEAVDASVIDGKPSEVFEDASLAAIAKFEFAPGEITIPRVRYVFSYDLTEKNL